MTHRDQNYDTTNAAPSDGTKFPAEQYFYCPVQLMGLSYDWTALNNKIDAMTPNGNTNQAIGLVWGWQSLTNPAARNKARPESRAFHQSGTVAYLADATLPNWLSNGL